ncbi:ABC transporter ATP-binding protein [Oscillibacter sp.]|uniref:ABC transporter ATP-binding protein n=1 Tax=Oscillibacter sp. TaxID=1945593 RepID=UPI0028AC97AA|nr:ABC transporter ATP-binding protein [Oscillibacter sp.]
MATPVVELKRVSKYFAKVIANKDVSFCAYEGEVVALLGENGAGKSTIMKILYGLYGADEGTILIRGQETTVRSPRDAMQRGIAMVQQHFSLVPTHTVTENIILGNARGRISLKEENQKIQALANRYGFDIPVEAKVGNLAVGVQQKVEILKALYLNTNILILDEPTAVLTPQESDNLMEFIKTYAAQGNTVLFITHKLKEVMEVADRVVVMRDGMVAGDLRRSETDEHKLAKLMIGQDLTANAQPALREFSDESTILELRNVTVEQKNQPALLEGVSFAVHAGEIFGIAGVSGNGQDAVCEAICGGREITSGEILCNGRSLVEDTIRQRIEAGIGYVPVDRYRDGLIMDMTLSENMLLKSSFSKHWTRHGLIDQKVLDRYTADLIQKHQVKATGPDETAKSLSGGNQQKMVLGREIDIGQKVIVFNQPTRGLDMGAVDRIHKSMLEEKEKGKGVLLISTELSELFEMTDRFAIMYKGKIMGIYRNGELSTEEIGLLMAGYTGKEA